MDPKVDEALIENKDDESTPLVNNQDQNISPELRSIMDEENRHFTCKRFIHIFICFASLMTT